MPDQEPELGFRSLPEPSESEALPDQPGIYEQLRKLEEMCLAEWKDATATGKLPEGWWPSSYVISYGDPGSSCYTLDFAGLRDWSTHSYSATLYGFQFIDGKMTDLAGTTISVTDQSAPEVTYADESLESTEGVDAQILDVYEDVLKALIDPSQTGVRIEVRFAKVRKATGPERLVADHSPRSLPGLLRALGQPTTLPS